MVDHEPAATPLAPDPLYMLAYDHRQVLRDLFPEAPVEQLEASKGIVLDALEILAADVDRASLAFLVDEEYGGAAARNAREREVYLAMPIEASRTPIFQFQHPDDYAERFADYDPHCVKALVFHNPADDDARKQEQIELLRRSGELAKQQGRDYLLEVLITPTAEQIEAGGGDKVGYRAKVFPKLLVESIAELQAAGIEPDVWKIEGLETVADTQAVADQANADGRDHVRCIVLGSGESQEKVLSWIANAAAVPTFSGFAIGRTIWHGPLGEHFAGAITREQASEKMARSFGELIAAFGREGS